MNIQLLKINRSRIREPYISFAASGTAHINKAVVDMVGIDNIKSVNIYQDEDYKKNFFIQFLAEDSGEIKVRGALKDKAEFSSAAIYRAMKEAFGLREREALAVRVGKPFEIAGGATVYPLLTNYLSKL